MDVAASTLHLSASPFLDEASLLAKVHALIERFRGSQAQLAFLWRALTGLMELPLPDAVLWSGLSASSNEELLEVWLSAARRPQRPERDRAAEAGLDALRTEGREARAAWLAGAHLRSEEVAARLRITRQAVNVRRQEHKLLAVLEGRAYLYPAWQFRGAGLLPGLERVLGELGPLPPLMVVQFLRAPTAELEDRSPVESLQAAAELPPREQADMQDAVVRAARLVGEHGGR
jgi:hypothetical protein